LEDGGCALIPKGGSYVALRSEDGSNYSVIIETVDATNRQELAFQVTGGLATTPVHVWRSNAEAQFVPLSDLTPADGRFTVTLDAGSIYSLTTTSGQTKGCADSPQNAPFPVPYTEDFESYSPGSTPRYFSDQAGIFEVASRNGGKGKCLRQIIDRKGIEWPFHLSPVPETFLGDPNWTDYEVSTDALIEKTGFISLFGRVSSIPQSASPPNGYWLKIDHTGEWELGTAKAAIVSGNAPFAANAWHNLRLSFDGTSIKAFIDNKLVANLTDDTYPCGMVGIGSGWNKAQFDNFSVHGTSGLVNLAFAKPATASSCAGVDYSPRLATDGDAVNSRWAAAEGKSAGEWLEIDLGASRSFNTAIVKEFEDRIGAYKIQAWNGSEWQDVLSGTGLGSTPKTITFPTVTANRVRLLVLEAKRSPSIWEFEIRNRP